MYDTNDIGLNALLLPTQRNLTFLMELACKTCFSEPLSTIYKRPSSLRKMLSFFLHHLSDSIWKFPLWSRIIIKRAISCSTLSLICMFKCPHGLVLIG